jgi:hypothetical protein
MTATPVPRFRLGPRVCRVVCRMLSLFVVYVFRVCRVFLHIYMGDVCVSVNVLCTCVCTIGV